MNKLGEYVRQLRGELSLHKFAKKCGLSHTHISTIEKGVDPHTKKPVRVTTETLKKIADGSGANYLYLAALAENIEELPPREEQWAASLSGGRQYEDLPPEAFEEISAHREMVIQKYKKK